MKSNLFITALLSLSLSALASPLADIANTVVAVDRSREALDRGDITFHITRTDDLINDEVDNAVLLERISHIMVKIQLNEEGLTVNGDPISLREEDQESGAKLIIVKAEALALPQDTPSTVLDAQQVQALVDHLSPGIVSLEVRIESELSESPTLEALNEEGEIVTQVVDGIRIRRVGVFVKINEVEGFNVAHSSFLYAPILQLLVTSDNLDGQRITQISTLSINGQTPTEFQPEPFIPEHVGATQPDVPRADPNMWDQSPDMFPQAPHHPPPPPHHHHMHHPLPPASFFGWLANALGLHRGPPHAHGHGFHPPCHRGDGPSRSVEGWKADRPLDLDATSLDSGRSELTEVDGEDAPQIMPPFRPHGFDRPHSQSPGTEGIPAPYVHHPPHRHALCLFRRFIQGVGYFLFTIWNTLLVKVILGVALGWALGVAFHRKRQARRAIQLRPSTPTLERASFDEDKKSFVDSEYSGATLPLYDEKVEVVIPVDSKPPVA